MRSVTTRWMWMAGWILGAFGGMPMYIAAQGVDLPLSLRDGRLVVEVSAPGGTPLPFVLSTGSAVTVLTESGARSLRGVAALRVESLTIDVDGAQVLSDDRFRVGDVNLAGAIGADILADYDVLIDLPNRRLRLKPASGAVSWPGVSLSDAIRVRVYHGVAIGLDIELDGTPLLAALDLGTPFVSINPPAAEKAGLAAGDTVTLRTGGVSLPSTEVHVTTGPVFERWDPTGAGFVVVGASIAANCALAISWIHREIRVCSR